MTKSLAALYWFKINRPNQPDSRFPREEAPLPPDTENGRSPESHNKLLSLWCRLWSKLWTSPPA